MAVAEEETMEEKDKGTLTYQECKVFHAEPHLCSVYDNNKTRIVTFEVYGLDTQDMFHKQYTYADFDGLFRFNAELMNPNRKEGRYNWVIRRLEIRQVGTDKKLLLSNEVTKEVPELPIYETTRKIPTGRMDLKERQRLREQMDMLNIRRDEKIRNKKEASKKKFLEHIFFLQEEAQRKEKAQEEAISHERELRYQWQTSMENQEEEEAARNAVVAKNRRIAAENKDKAHEEKEEEDLRQLRLRWKAADAEKRRQIDDARDRKDKEAKAQAEADKQAASHGRKMASKRDQAHKARDKRVKTKMWNAVQKALDLIPELNRLKNLKAERNREYLQDWNDQRWPIFEAQLEKMRDRAAQRLAEADAVKAYHAQREIPKRENLKGRKAKAKGKAKAKPSNAEETGDESNAETKAKAKPKKKKPAAEDDDKQDAERIVDGVEAKMRAEMAEAKRRSDLEQKRAEKIKEKEARIKQVELKRIEDYKAKYRGKSDKIRHEANERRIMLATKEEEKQRAQERQKEESERLNNVREKHVVKWEEKQIAFLCAQQVDLRVGAAH